MKTRVISIRVMPEQGRLWEAAARARGMTLLDWIRFVCESAVPSRFYTGTHNPALPKADSEECGR